MVINKKSNDFEIHPATPDPVRAVVVDITRPKARETKFGVKEKFSIVFETELKMDDGKPWTFWAHGYTANIGDKSNLARDAKKILGVADLPEPFDTEALIGKPVRMMIEHRRDGETVFANMSYLSAHKGADGLAPSGTFTREKDRNDGGEGGSSYNKLPSTGKDTAGSWQDTKVHVGQFAGHAVADLPSLDAVDRLLSHWWPSVQAKPSADDRRLHAALLEARQAFATPANDPAANF